MTGELRRCAVLGSPVGHSRSPAIWRAAFAELALPWTYDAIECDEAALPAFTTLARADPTWAALSLTMPLKHAVGDLLDESRSPVRAVNTVLVDRGRLVGHNTDVAGVLAAWEELGPAACGPVVVLGAGGTAEAAVAALRERADVAVVARRPDVAAALGCPVLPWSPASLLGAGVVVNTTPATAADELVRGGWPGGALVEALYDPWPTALAGSASAAGCAVVGGLTVLVGQAVAAIELVTGRRPSVSPLRAAAEGRQD